MLSRFSATGENDTLLLYEIKHTLFFLLVFFAFSESLFAKNHSCTSFNYLEKGFYCRQTSLGLNFLSLYDNH